MSRWTNMAAVTAEPLCALIQFTSNLNGPAFLSPNRNPTELTLLGSSFWSGNTLPRHVATNLSTGRLTSIHSPFFVLKDLRKEYRPESRDTYKLNVYSRPSPR